MDTIDCVTAPRPALRRPRAGAGAWSRIAAVLRADGRVVLDEGDRLVVADRYLVRGRAVGQDVEVARSEVSGAAWLVLTAMVAGEHAFGPREALAHNASLAAGALGLVGESYVLRDAVPLAALDADDVIHLIALVGNEAARLRAVTSRTPVDAAMFDAYAV